MIVVPAGSDGPLLVQANQIVEANVWEAFSLLTILSTGWDLADNTAHSKRAVGFVHTATADQFWLITAPGTIYQWPGHGLGSAGDLLWLGTAGEFVAAEPSGGAAVVIQVVATVIDAEYIFFHFDPPVLI